MFYEFLYPLKNLFSPFNIFHYITFRAAMSAITALLLSFLIGPAIIKYLKKNQIGEIVRHNSPSTHLSKQGTPTMGGIIILISVLTSMLLWGNLSNVYTIIILIATIWMGLIGFIDDYLKSVKGYKDGLVAKYKLIGQLTFGLALGLFIYFCNHFEEYNSITSIPFLKNANVDFGLFYIIFIAVVITGTSNAVNLTDGLDGLATGLVGIISLTLSIICYITGRVDFSSYLNTIYIPGSGELTVYSMALSGALLGFLWFNCKPAEVFMGDTGSLFLGGAIGTIAVLAKKEILLVLLGGIFVVEAASVLIQVTYFKYTKKKYGEGKRVFLMAPLHHHFELKGWPETKIVIRFWIIGILLALISLSSFKLL
ncbi:MAG: phospho-N-acetylmuramoyl-pentapeptide-transferase [Candidatus Marinimicrobia bacterium]|nr:phospho-N-acetylmuramoyl-pentapeptide-transferase [Candidatus Neomarinimicrobiota bacterium]